MQDNYYDWDEFRKELYETLEVCGDNTELIANLLTEVAHGIKRNLNPVGVIWDWKAVQAEQPWPDDF